MIHFKIKIQFSRKGQITAPGVDKTNMYITRLRGSIRSMENTFSNFKDKGNFKEMTDKTRETGNCQLCPRSFLHNRMDVQIFILHPAGFRKWGKKTPALCPPGSEEQWAGVFFLHCPPGFELLHVCILRWDRTSLPPWQIPAEPLSESSQSHNVQ